MVRAPEDIVNYEHDEILNAKRVIGAFERNTAFNEQVIALRTSKFNPKLTWGRSKLRDKIITTGSGSFTESEGAGVLSSGTTANSYAEIRTRERGQYQAGTEGEAGIGIRVGEGLIVNDALQGDEEIRWQYCDNEFGFGHGIDATGIFVFRVNDGIFEKMYQYEWNGDKLDGSDNPVTNPSGIKLDLELGSIFQINFVWYGHGNIQFYLNIKNSSDNTDNRVLLHTLQVERELSTVDPNQPISVVVENDDTGRDLVVYIGGRQFSLVDGNSITETRNTVALITAATLSNQTWVPILAVRKKATFNGRTNSINSYFKSIGITVLDNTVDWYVSIGDTVTDGTWGAIPRTPADETALEQNSTLTAGGTTQYRQILAGTVGAGKEINTVIDEQALNNLGDDLVVVFWARETTSSDASVNVYLNFEEEW